MCENTALGHDWYLSTTLTSRQRRQMTTRSILQLQQMGLLECHVNDDSQITSNERTYLESVISSSFCCLGLPMLMVRSVRVMSVVGVLKGEVSFPLANEEEEKFVVNLVGFQDCEKRSHHQHFDRLSWRHHHFGLETEDLFFVRSFENPSTKSTWVLRGFFPGVNQRSEHESSTRSTTSTARTLHYSKPFRLFMWFY